jgi:hypothetical protein
MIVERFVGAPFGRARSVETRQAVPLGHGPPFGVGQMNEKFVVPVQ